MNPVTGKHPAREVLEAFGLGKLDDASTTQVGHHLETCVDCKREVAALSSDSLLDQLRKAIRTDGTPAPEKVMAPLPSTALPASVPAELQNNPQYEILRELGAGGMGVVYLAKNKLMDRLEVLKIISTSMMRKAGALDRFLREIRAAASLSHDNVVKAYSAIQLGELLVFAMEYVEGEDLAKLIKRQGALPVHISCYYVRQVALGLQHAHDKSMVHRDIKPHNLVLARDGKKHTVKILDFGLAKATSEKKLGGDLTGDGKMLGTPDYMAPEQIQDAAHADIRADIYSLGCTLYFLLTAAPPFESSNLFGLLQAHQIEDPKPLNELRPEAPAELAAVAVKMMAKDPAQRYQKPIEVAQALMPFIKPGAKGGGALPGSPEQPAAAPKDAKPTPSERTADRPKPKTLAPSRAPSKVGASAKSAVKAFEFEPVPAQKRATKKAKAPQRFKPWVLAGIGVAVGVVLLGLLAAGAVLRVQTKDGTIVVENVPADADVLVDGESITIRRNGETVTANALREGPHRLKVMKGSVELLSSDVTVKLGDVPVRLRVEPRVAAAKESPSKESNGKAPPKEESIAKAPAKMVALSEPDFALAPFDPKLAAKHQKAWGDYLKRPVIEKSGTGIEMVLIPPGGGMMSQPWRLGKYEVTQAQFMRVMGWNPSWFQGERAKGADPKTLPVEEIRWYVAVEFCNELSKLEKLKPYYEIKAAKREGEEIVEAEVKILGGDGYRLPTELEWEYACRAGSDSRFGYSDREEDLDKYGWYEKNSDGRSHKVGEKLPNGFGLYDMHGNANEWCWDPGSTGALDRVSRGGGRGNPAYCCSAGTHFAYAPASRYVDFGLRLARGPSYAETDAKQVAEISHAPKKKDETPVGSVNVDKIRNAADDFETIWYPFDPTPLPPWKLPKDAPKPALAPYDAKQAKKHQEEWAAHFKIPVVQENSIGMKFALIPPGEFDLVRSWGVDFDPNAPKRRIRLAHGYCLGTTEVTYSQFSKFVEETGYRTVAETNGTGIFEVYLDNKNYPEYNWRKPGPIGVKSDHPVVGITAQDARAFCAWLSKKEKAIYRLPTEAEWENACRAGSESKRGICERDENLWEHAWKVRGVRSSDPIWVTEPPFHRVAQKLPNAFGLFDLLGNVHERCAADLFPTIRSWMPPRWFPTEHFSNIDPRGLAWSDGAAWTDGAFRGGGFNGNESWLHPGLRSVESRPQLNTGFRVLRQVSPIDETPSFLKPLTVARGTPVSRDAFVPRPTPIQGLLSWTIGMQRHPMGMTLRSADDFFATIQNENDGAVAVWSKAGRLRHLLLGHLRPIAAIDISVDGRLLASTDYECVRVWDLETGLCLKEFTPPVLGPHSVLFSPDRKSLLVSRWDGSIVVDLSTGRPQWLPRGLFRRRWSPSGDKIAMSTGTWWESQNRKVSVVPLSKMTDAVEVRLPNPEGDPAQRELSALCWSPDGEEIAVCDLKGSVYILDSRTLAIRSTLEGQHEANDIAWSRDGKKLLVRGNESISVWTLKDKKSARFRIEQKRSPIAAAVWAEDSRSILVGQTSPVGRTWWIDSATGALLREGTALPDAPIAKSTARWGIFGDGNDPTIAVSAPDFGAWKIFRSKDGALVETKPWSWTGAMRVSPGGKFVAIHDVSLWNGLIVCDAALKSAPRKMKDGIHSYEWSPDGTLLALAGNDKQVSIVRAADGTRLTTLHEGKEVHALAWSTNGKLLATFDADRKVIIWEWEKGICVRTLELSLDANPRDNYTLQWSPDDRTLWCGIRDHLYQFDLFAAEKREWFEMGREVQGPYSTADGSHHLVRRNGTVYQFELNMSRRTPIDIPDGSFRFLQDNRRVIAGMDACGYATCFDLKTHQRLGTLIPQLGDKDWVCIGPGGHYIGSAGIEKHIVYVAITDAGKQEIYTPAEFASRFGWKNDPSKARFAELAP